MTSGTESPPAGSLTRGVVYAAFGEQFVNECLVSASSLARRCPDIDFTIFTDDQETITRALPDANVVVISLPKHGDQQSGWEWRTFHAKYTALTASPYDHTLFLDTDTVILGDVQPLFALLERFDVAARDCTPWWGQSKADYLMISSAPLVFAEYNTGVLLVNLRSPRVSEFLAAWRTIFEKMFADEGTRSSDQQSFREAVWETGVAIYTLKHSFNYWGDTGSHMPVVIAHKQLNKANLLANADWRTIEGESAAIAPHPAWDTLCKAERNGRSEERVARLKKYEARLLAKSTRALKRTSYGQSDGTSTPATVNELAETFSDRFRKQTIVRRLRRALKAIGL